jgi:iron complex transport system substrate-binding protein
MYADGGLIICLKILPGTGGSLYRLKTVLDKAIHADFWLIKYHNETNLEYAALRESTPLTRLRCFKKKTIYGSNSPK